MEIGSFDFEFKTFDNEALFPVELFLRNVGECAEWDSVDCKANFPNKLFCSE